MSAGQVSEDLNTVIANAVKARVESEVLAALSGDAVIGQFVADALHQEVEVKGSGYRSEKIPFITQVLRSAIRDATKEAVAQIITEERPAIEDAVRKALRRDIAGIATQVTDSMVKAAANSYGITVTLKTPADDR